MNTTPPESWYAFHFGTQFVNSPQFDPHSLFEPVTHDCYVMMADLCSFTAFFKATESLRAIEPIMTTFYSQVRKSIHKHFGMLDKIIGDAVLAVWGLHLKRADLIRPILEASRELAGIALRTAEQWQSKIDILVEPKGLRIGLSKGPILVIPRDVTHPGLSLLGNPINLASRLQVSAQANQLICSNVVYQDIQQAGLDLNFQPFKNDQDGDFLEARNYGPIKAWVLALD